MATNTGENYREGSVKDRIQLCDPETKICTKYDTNTNEVLDVKIGKFKGVAECKDLRSNERSKKFCSED